MALGVCIDNDTNDLKVEINQLDTDEVLHATTEARLQELGDMLQDCINLIFYIEGSRYVTLSCVPFALYCLLQHLEPKRGDDASIAISRSTLRNYVVEKYPIYPVHYLATYLDPRFKNLEPFVQPEEHAAKLHDIAELLEDPIHTLCSNQPHPTPDVPEQRQEEPPRKKGKIHILQKMRADHSAAFMHLRLQFYLWMMLLRRKCISTVVYCK